MNVFTTTGKKLKKKVLVVFHLKILTFVYTDAEDDDGDDD